MQQEPQRQRINFGGNDSVVDYRVTPIALSVVDYDVTVALSVVALDGAEASAPFQYHAAAAERPERGREEDRGLDQAAGGGTGDGRRI